MKKYIQTEITFSGEELNRVYMGTILATLTGEGWKVTSETQTKTLSNPEQIVAIKYYLTREI